MSNQVGEEPREQSSGQMLLYGKKSEYLKLNSGFSNVEIIDSVIRNASVCIKPDYSGFFKRVGERSTQLKRVMYSTTKECNNKMTWA